MSCGTSPEFCWNPYDSIQQQCIDPSSNFGMPSTLEIKSTAMNALRSGVDTVNSYTDLEFRVTALKQESDGSERSHRCAVIRDQHILGQAASSFNRTSCVACGEISGNSADQMLEKPSD
jgi:hypothetical protein